MKDSNILYMLQNKSLKLGDMMFLHKLKFYRNIFHFKKIFNELTKLEETIETESEVVNINI